MGGGGYTVDLHTRVYPQQRYSRFRLLMPLLAPSEVEVPVGQLAEARQSLASRPTLSVDMPSHISHLARRPLNPPHDSRAWLCQWVPTSTILPSSKGRIRCGILFLAKRYPLVQ